MLADRILAGPNIPRHRFVDEGNRRRPCSIAALDEAALHEFYLERADVVAADDANIWNQNFAIEFRAAFHLNA